MHLTRKLFLCSALLLAMTVSAPAADDTRGAVEQSGGSLPQNPSLPKLNLNDEKSDSVTAETFAAEFGGNVLMQKTRRR